VEVARWKRSLEWRSSCMLRARVDVGFSLSRPVRLYIAIYDTTIEIVKTEIALGKRPMKVRLSHVKGCGS
jgi:hypothetical protein